MIEGGHADNRILECAVEASADYLVTGDSAAICRAIEEHMGVRIVNAPRKGSPSQLAGFALAIRKEVF